MFAKRVGKDVVSRVWRKVKTDWDVWSARPLQDEPVIRLVLDGTLVRAARPQGDRELRVKGGSGKTKFP